MKYELLKGEKVTLREMRADDRDLIHDWENRPELKYLGDEHETLSKEQIADFIERASGDIYTDGQLRLMIDLHPSTSLRAQRGNRPEGVHRNDNLSAQGDCFGRSSLAMTVGCIDLFEFDQHNQRAGVGILIAETENRKRGHAKEALNLLTNYCFEVLNLRQLYCHIPVDNEASLRLFSTCGFEETGRCRNWVKKGNAFIDAVFMQRLNG
ncbi:MAG: GNAT family N-acetyltransferase [Flavobacteriales bacterium]|nr:GNAT family N-acetyltransferase [Flavobacteriales bacterium]